MKTMITFGARGPAPAVGAVDSPIQPAKHHESASLHVLDDCLVTPREYHASEARGAGDSEEAPRHGL